MAKIFKVSGYIVDVNGDSNVDEVIAEVGSGFDGMINQHIHVEEADIGKWDDEEIHIPCDCGCLWGFECEYDMLTIS